MAKKKEEGKAEAPKKKVGKPRAVKDAEHFGELIDGFIQDISTRMHKDNTAIPDDYMLLRYIQGQTGRPIAITTLYDYRENKGGRYPGYAEEYKKIETFRAYFWNAKALANPKVTGFAAFALKQPKNGGWTDKQTVEVPEIKIKIAGGGDLHDIGQ